MRILHAPIVIAGQAVALRDVSREAGHESEVWTFGEPGYGIAVDRILEAPADARSAVSLVQDVIAGEWDVVHFHFARTFVRRGLGLPLGWDVDALTATGAKAVFSFHGTDVRRASLEKQLDPWSYYHADAASRDEAAIAEDLAMIRPRAHVMTYSTGGLRDHLPDGVHLPVTVDVEGLAPGADQRAVPVIAHAPSSRATKGSSHVLAAFESLRAEGVRFDVDLIEGVSQTEAVARMRAADVVVEKVLGDGYGVTAVEAMAMGRAVVTRATERSHGHLGDFPCAQADPDSLVDTLRSLIGDVELRQRIGDSGLEFARRVHSVDATRARLDDLYSDSPAQPERLEPDGEWIQRRLATLDEEAALRRQQVSAAREASVLHQTAANDARTREQATREERDEARARVRELERTNAELSRTFTARAARAVRRLRGR